MPQWGTRRSTRSCPVLPCGASTRGLSFASNATLLTARQRGQLAWPHGIEASCVCSQPGPLPSGHRERTGFPGIPSAGSGRVAESRWKPKWKWGCCQEVPLLQVPRDIARSVYLCVLPKPPQTPRTLTVKAPAQAPLRLPAST